MGWRSVKVKRAILQGVLLSALVCATVQAAPKSAVVQQNLWKYAPAGQTRDFHLVLVWKETLNDLAIQIAHPEWLAQALSRECAKYGMGRPRSYQIIDRAEDLYGWVRYWSSDTPVLWANAHLMLRHSTSAWTANLEVRTRFQPFLFDAVPVEAPLQAGVSRPVTSSDLKTLDAYREWLAQSEPRIYLQFSTQCAANPGTFEKKESLFHYYLGKSEGMQEAYRAAQAGDWGKAKQVWLRELERGQDDPVIYFNLSVAAQMLGEWDPALEYAEQYEAHKPRGLKRIFSGLPMSEERVRTLRGLSLIFKRPSHSRQFDPKSKLAVLLFENITNDLVVPDKFREALVTEAVRRGYATVPLTEIEEKLRLNGFTDGGQFGATTPQKLGKMVGASLLVMGEVEGYSQATLRLVDAVSGETIFSKELHAFTNPDTIETIEEAKERRKNSVKRPLPPLVKSGPDEHYLTAAEQFFQPWPRKLNEK